MKLNYMVTRCMFYLLSFQMWKWKNAYHALYMLEVYHKTVLLKYLISGYILLKQLLYHCLIT